MIVLASTFSIDLVRRMRGECLSYDFLIIKTPTKVCTANLGGRYNLCPYSTTFICVFGGNTQLRR